MTALDPGYFYVIEKGMESGAGEWQQFMLEGNIFQGFSRREIHIYLWNYRGGRVYFDDHVIRRYRNMVTTGQGS